MKWWWGIRTYHLIGVYVQSSLDNYAKLCTKLYGYALDNMRHAKLYITEHTHTQNKSTELD